MKDTPYRYFILEAAKITFYCLLVAGVVKFFGASSDVVLIVFNMAVMSAAATFSPGKKQLSDVMLGSIVIILSIVIAGLFGFYTPLLSKLLSILYAGLAFLLPKTNSKMTIFVTGAVMFFIFSSLPFDLRHGLAYLGNGLIVVILLILLTWIFNLIFYDKKEPYIKEKAEGNKINAAITTVALLLAWIIGYQLKLHTTISHLYWIGLTVLVVIQSSHQHNIQMATKRIIINFSGALIVIVLFNYVVPSNFWINFALLVFFLFFIFALGFSYTGRTLFIEMFVLGFTHLLGGYHNVIAIDRVVLTLIGGLLIIITTFVCCFFFNLFNMER